MMSKKAIRFLSSCLASGEHREAGSVHEIDAEEAEKLIRMGRAVEVESAAVDAPKKRKKAE